MPGTDHGHRFVIRVRGYASETNVLIIYSFQPVGVWILRSFLRTESHLWEMFVLSQVASHLLIYMFWFFFPLFFSLWFPSSFVSHINNWHFHISKPILKAWLGLPHLRVRRLLIFLAMDNYTQVGNKEVLPKTWSIDHRRKRMQCIDYS